ncbi:MAG: hypothetical protein WC683_07500 [bacterium]|jgi:hypothetical protein
MDAIRSIEVRQNQIAQRIGALAYRRMRLVRELEMVDKEILQLEAASTANDQATGDIRVAVARQEGAAKATQPKETP